MEVETGPDFEVEQDSIDTEDKKRALESAQETLKQQRSVYKSALTSLTQSIKEKSGRAYNNIRLHGKEIAKRNQTRRPLFFLPCTRYKIL